MKKFWQLIGIVVVGFVLIQLIPFGRDHTNPAVVTEAKWNSPQTKDLARRACYDCHSNETVWPWYSNIAPFSWLVMKDVNEGRGILNFSEWSATPSVRTERGGRSSGQGVANVVLEGEMPPVIYIPTHPEANLSQAERKQLADGIQALFANPGN